MMISKGHLEKKNPQVISGSKTLRFPIHNFLYSPLKHRDK